MDETSESPWRFLGAALAFEAGLGVLALAVGWALGQSPLETLDRNLAAHPNLAAVLWGGMAAVPMVIALLLMDRYPLGPLRRLRQFVHDHLVPMFAPLKVGHLLLLSMAAGVGEEMLFRGFLQAGIARWMGPPLGVAVGLGAASLLFGLCHWVTPTYAVLAALIGVYLGCLFLITGNLLAPITTHAVYDAVALLYLTKKKRRPEP